MIKLNKIEYFVCYRYRNHLDDEYIKEFYNERFRLGHNMHKTFENAKKQEQNIMWDDDDHAIIKVINGKIFKKVTK